MARQSQVPQERRKQAPYPAQRQVWIPASHAENHQKSWPGSGKLLLATIFLILFSLAALIGLTSATLLFFYSDLIFPGVHVVDIPVGALTTGQAKAILRDEIPQREILLVHSSGAWPVTVAELGLAMDVDATVQQGYELGRTSSGRTKIASGEMQIEPLWSLDLQQATAQFEQLAPGVGEPAVDAQVVIEGNQAIAVPPQDGLALDLAMTMDYLRKNPTEIVTTGQLPLATRATEAEITNTNVLASEAQRLLSKQVLIRAFDPILNQEAEWVIPTGDWQEWLKLVVSPGEQDPFSWVMDEAAAQQYLATGWEWLGERRYLDAEALLPQMIDVITSGRTAIETRAYHQPIQHIVRPGESFSSIGYNYGIPYPWVQQANPGINNLAVGDVVTIPSADDMLPLPIIPGKRVVVGLGEQRARVYEDGQLIWDWPASTGISNSPTSPGIFQVQTHQEEAYASNWDLQMPKFLGIYRPVPSTDFMNGFHGFPTRDGQNLLWTGDLGHPVTYGCILLSSENAQKLYDWAEDGVIVEVQR